MGRFKLFTAGIVMLTVLSGCSGNNQQDLEDFIQETKRRPKKQVEPLPTFPPYESFTYSASQLRNPFEQPVAELKDMVAKGTDVKPPDPDRPKELLESYNFDQLTMVGHIQKGGVFWALINDGEGYVHRVTKGNYLGKNYGRVVAASPTQVDVVEIVTDGLDGWVERPRVLKLAEKE